MHEDELLLSYYFLNREMKRIIVYGSIFLAALIVAFILLKSVSAPTVSILGDSYSTFYGHVPEGHACWYGTPDFDKNNDVRSVEETWWQRFLSESGWTLVLNNSYSGSTICNTGYGGADFSDRSFITRAKDLGNPDVILVFGGTNDSWAKSPVGDFKYADWTADDLYRFRPAFCYLLDYLTTHYAKAKIYNITNTQLSSEVEESMEEICRHYQVPNIRLHDIDKQEGHPSVMGMDSICEQVSRLLLRK